jgi:hypothetical protein
VVNSGLPMVRGEVPDERPGLVCAQCGCRHFEERLREQYGRVSLVKVCRHCGRRAGSVWRVQTKSGD